MSTSLRAGRASLPQVGQLAGQRRCGHRIAGVYDVDGGRRAALLEEAHETQGLFASVGWVPPKA